MTANAVTTLTGSYRTTRTLVSDGTDARIGRCGCSCLPTRAAKVGLGARRDGHKFCRDGHETDKGHLEYRKDHRRATLRHQREAHCHRHAVHCIGEPRRGHPLGCEELWGNREEDEGTGADDGGAWERKKRVDIAGWLCLHASIIDHADGGMLFTSLLHPSRCKPTCSTRLHERSRHQRR